MTMIEKIQKYNATINYLNKMTTISTVTEEVDEIRRLVTMFGNKVTKLTKKKKRLEDEGAPIDSLVMKCMTTNFQSANTLWEKVDKEAFGFVQIKQSCERMAKIGTVVKGRAGFVDGYRLP